MAIRSYPDEFKIEAVRQVTDRGYKPKDVAERLGVTTKSIHNWMKQFGADSNEQQKLTELEAEIKRLKAENRRVTEERNILKEAAVDSIGQRNNHMKILFCGGLLNEAYIYSTRKRICFRFMETRKRL